MQDNGKVLRQRREELGLSQAELSRRAGTSQTLISRLETGRKKLVPAAVGKIIAALELELKIEKAGRRR